MTAHASGGRARWAALIGEFTHHLPYTIVGTFVAMGAVWWFANQYHDGATAEDLGTNAVSLFHLFHPLHVCLSAIATTSLAWRYRRNALLAIMIGALGSAIPCGLSDYVFPYVGGIVLGQPMHFHVCIVEHPQLFFSFLVLGILGGFWAEERLAQSHLFSHGAHIFVSSTASLLYLVSFGFTAWMADVRYLFPAFFVIVLAVWIPCCISDIVVPVSAAYGGPKDEGRARAAA